MSVYYFYQATSGMLIFLHPLDIFTGTPCFWIVVHVEAASEGSTNADMQQCCKYLLHMLEGSNIVSIEVDLKHIIGTDGWHTFK